METTKKNTASKETISPKRIFFSNRYTTKSLVIMALFAAICCISSYISFPLPNGTHITFLNFMITLIALIFPLSESFMIVFVWMLLGCVGLPVFIAGSSGIGYLFAAWGGYTIAFLFVPIVIALLLGKTYHRIRASFAAIVSVIFVDLFGMIQMMLLSDLTLAQAIVPGFLSFIFLDLVKAVVAAQVAPAFRSIVLDD